MAGGAEQELVGIAKHFNSVNNYGRANVAKATYASIFLIWAGFKAKKSLSSK
uniref:Up-regulated during skeletal muscle growth protein 5 n=1 Tax=Centropages tenuiremis TaxID=544689 RepID=A0A0U2LGJ3_9MAXI|nr:up-regulated during skeletal muscle growth protein 5 [Centropages tenuiremis]